MSTEPSYFNADENFSVTRTAAACRAIPGAPPPSPQGSFAPAAAISPSLVPAFLAEQRGC